LACTWGFSFCTIAACALQLDVQKKQHPSASSPSDLCNYAKKFGALPPKAKLATVDEGYQYISQYIPGFVERDDFVVLLMGSFPEALNIRGV
jgi:hypothetical protein